MRTRAVLTKEGRNGRRSITVVLPPVKVERLDWITYHGERWMITELWSEPIPEHYRD